MVDRGRGDPRNIIGVIVDRDENDLYRIAVKAGILSTKYSRNQFDFCPQRLLNETDVNTVCTITPSGLQLLVGKGSSTVTVANSVRRTDASVLKQKNFVIAGVTAV